MCRMGKHLKAKEADPHQASTLSLLLEAKGVILKKKNTLIASIWLAFDANVFHLIQWETKSSDQFMLERKSSYTYTRIANPWLNP